MSTLPVSKLPVSLAAAGQFRDALLRIGITFEICGRRVEEPFDTLVGTPGRDERIGVGVKEARGARTRSSWVQVCGLQGHDGLVVFAEVHSSTCNDDPQFACVVARQCAGFIATTEFDGTLGAAEATFAVGHDSQKSWAACHSACGAQFGQRLSPLARVVGSNACSFAYDSNSTRPLPCGASVCKCEARVVVEQIGDHDQVPCNGFGVGLVEAEQIATYNCVEVARCDVVG